MPHRSTLSCLFLGTLLAVGTSQATTHGEDYGIAW